MTVHPDGIGRPTGWSIVVPSIGRPSLRTLIDSVTAAAPPAPEQVVVVDDRPHTDAPLDLPESTLFPLRVVCSGGAGPAAARNVGWRLATSEWVVFLDDDVMVTADWARALQDDLDSAGPTTGGVQGNVIVPAVEGRRPTDAERGTQGLSQARWITADMAYRRAALVETGGFDARFPRAYREDADIALRVRRAGWRLTRGSRSVIHPPRAGRRGDSVRAQRGNGDDALMSRLHGPDWRALADIGSGRLPWHGAAVAAGTTAALSGLWAHARPDRRTPRWLAVAGRTAYLGLTADFLLRRVLPGPRTPAELVEMTWTSLLIPPLALWHRVRGWQRFRTARPWLDITNPPKSQQNGAHP